MATLKGFDTPLDMVRHAPALRRRGYDFVMRCYSRDPGRNLGLDEARRLSDAGLHIGALWLHGATHEAYFTRQQGLLDGADALRLARAAGQPAGSAIYVAVGHDATRDEVDGPISAYFTGIRATLSGAAGYRVGVHGSGRCCAAMVDRGLATLAWLSQARGFAGTQSDAHAMRYDLLQWMATRIALGGETFEITPDIGNPGRDPGLFQVEACDAVAELTLPLPQLRQERELRT
jgi:hypothetical protein